VGVSAAELEVAEGGVGIASVSGASGARGVDLDDKVKFGWEVSGECGRRQGDTHLMEIQVNGGTVAQKVDYAYTFFEKQIPVDTVLQNWRVG